MHNLMIDILVIILVLVVIGTILYVFSGNNVSDALYEDDDEGYFSPSGVYYPSGPYDQPYVDPVEAILPIIAVEAAEAVIDSDRDREIVEPTPSSPDVFSGDGGSGGGGGASASWSDDDDTRNNSDPTPDYSSDSSDTSSSDSSSSDDT